MALICPLLWRIFNRNKTEDSIQPPTTPQAPQAPQTPEPSIKTETHKVAGVSFRQDAFEKLAIKNEDYNKTKRELIDAGLTDVWIYEYDFYPRRAQLVPEPDNPKDPKAIRVVVDEQHIGYIKAGSCAHLHKLIKSGQITKMTCKIGGGSCKIIRAGMNDYGRMSYSLERDNINFWATLSIDVTIT